MRGGGNATRSRSGGRPRRLRGDRLFAAVDLGTNNCRLLVAQPEADGFRVVDAYSRIVRLGEGVAETGVLSEAAMQRAISALRVCAAKIRRMRVRHARYVATEACRRAANYRTFLEQVTAETGIQLEIIPAEEEARLALAGCVQLLDPAHEFAMVFDIGGGSTELIWARLSPGEVPEMAAWTSIPVGVVTLAEQFDGGEPDTHAYSEMVRFVEERLAPFEEEHRASVAFAQGSAQMIGISGTITTLAAVQLDLPRYDRSKVDGQSVSTAAVGEISQRLAGMSYAERSAHPCILKGRADLVIPGCAALEAILRLWPAPEVRVADRGLREGILRTMMGADPAVAPAASSAVAQ